MLTFDAKNIKNDHDLAEATDSFFETLRKQEYSRIDEQGHVYLDYTGGNLYAASQIQQHFELLQHRLFGNPHSTNPTSQLATQLVAESRQKVISYFKADDYYCIFTQNASGALKIVGECYPFDKNGHFLLLSDNHNSVNGIREYCKKRGGNFKYAPIQYEDLAIDAQNLNQLLEAYPDDQNKLFAFPAQSNVSGVKHDLEWIEKAHQQGWDVLLDAAAFVPTSPLDLSQIKPDFVSISFYKIFGYPTGIGCLLVRKDKFEKLAKPWFAGGTVSLVSVATDHHFLAKNHERFENGTVNYLDIPALKIGLEFIESIGIENIKSRVNRLICDLIGELKLLKHENGKSLVKIFGSTDPEHRGATIVVNFFDLNGKLIPFESIEKLANKDMISIRSGCFCNPGIDEINNCLSNDELAQYFTSRDSGDYYSMIEYLGKMRGATRISLGIATVKNDITQFLTFVKKFQNLTVDDIINSEK